MEKIRFIIVPLNLKACHELDYAVDFNRCSKADFNIWYLDELEFEELYKTGIFDQINTACDLMIDDFENERLNNEFIDSVLELIKEGSYFYNIQIVKLVELLKLAKSKSTFIEFDF